MKKLSLKKRSSILIFIAFAALSVACVHPVYNWITAEVNAGAEKMRREVEQKTGLTISYDAVSPSILSGFRAKGIVLSNAADGAPLITVRKAVLRYDLGRLIRRDYAHVFRMLIIDGVTLNFNSRTDKDVLNKLLSFVQNGNQITFNPDSFSANLPISVLVRNVTLTYADPLFSVTVALKKASFGSNVQKNEIPMNASGSFSVRSGAFSFSTTVAADGVLTDGFRKSSLLLRFSRLSGPEFTADGMNILASYADRTVTVRSVQNFIPVSLRCSYNIDSGAVGLSASADWFQPLSFIEVRKKQAQFKPFKNVSVSGRLDASYSVRTQKLSYTSAGTVALPSSLVDGGLTASYHLNGGRESITMESCTLKGAHYDASLSGSYRFKNMQLAGSADLRKIELPNGGVLSAELYFDPLEKGFQCFAPQLYLGGKPLTAFQLSLIPHQGTFDFSVDVSDYSHSSAETPGNIRIDGSFLPQTQDIQAGVTISNFYLDSAAETASFFFDTSTGAAVSSFKDMLAPYLFSGELYLSSNFKTFSYNVVYAVIANTEKDNEFLFLSLDGNDTSFQVSKMDLVYHGTSVHLSAQADIDTATGALFSVDMTAGAIPYHFNGSIVNGWYTLVGDYGVNVQVHRDESKTITGSLSAENFPLSLPASVFIFSLDSRFTWSPQEGINLALSRFEAEDAGGKLSFHPKLIVSGEVTKYGAFLDSVAYSDSYSSLNGNLKLNINADNGLFSSAHLDGALANPVSAERVSLSADVTNPDKIALSKQALLDSVYLNMQLTMNNFGLSRFMKEQSENNSLTGSVSVTGTVEKPLIAVSVDSLNLMAAGIALTGNGSASLQDGVLSVPALNIHYGAFDLSGVTAEFSAESLSGKAAGELDMSDNGVSMKVPLALSISDVTLKQGGVTPESATVTLSSDAVSASFLKKTFPLSVTAVYADGTASVLTSDNIGLSGWFNRDGLLSFSIPESYPLHFTMKGNASNGKMAVSVTNFYADTGKIFAGIALPEFVMYGGVLQGAFQINGMQTDPEFLGALMITDADFSFPKIIPDHITVKKALMMMNHSEMSVPQVSGKVKNETIMADAHIYFDRWLLDRLETNLKVPDGTCIPADYDVGYADFAGFTNIDLKLVYQDDVLDVTGKIYVRDVNATIRASEITSSLLSSNGSEPGNVRCDVDILLGSHVNIILNPLLHAVLVPNTQVNLKMDQPQETFSVKGDVSLRSGDIAYLNRNFYLKSGTIKFGDTGSRFDPIITVNAETRERDDDGNEVRILLTAENQYLSNFNPIFSSIPAKSESDIRKMLGQIAVGDSSSMSSFLFAAGDYAVQSTVGRVLEDRLRRFLNFDIFSVRTMVIQNTLKQSLSSSSNHSSMTVGNFLDNSTVYIGKYFGSVVYADALLHWTYDKTRVDDTTTIGGLIFKPEIGLEFESPFVLIRWNTAPNIDAMLNKMLVPSTSITLSWKVSF